MSGPSVVSFLLLLICGFVAAHAASGDRILQYLHSRGEALEINAPSPIKAVYADSRDGKGCRCLFYGCYCEIYILVKQLGITSMRPAPLTYWLVLG